MKKNFFKTGKSFWPLCLLLVLVGGYFASQYVTVESETWIGIGSMAVALWIASSQGRREEQRFAERKHVLIMSLSTVMVQANSLSNSLTDNLRILRDSGMIFENLSPQLEGIKQFVKQIESIDLLGSGSPKIVVEVSRFVGALKGIHESGSAALVAARTIEDEGGDQYGNQMLIAQLYVRHAEEVSNSTQTISQTFFNAGMEIERGTYSGPF